jgi:hypothetical protein
MSVCLLGQGGVLVVRRSSKDGNFLDERLEGMSVSRIVGTLLAISHQSFLLLCHLFDPDIHQFL